MPKSSTDPRPKKLALNKETMRLLTAALAADDYSERCGATYTTCDSRCC